MISSSSGIQPVRLVRKNLSNFVESALEKCVDIRSLRKAHACVLTHGFSYSIDIKSKLLGCYAYLGSLSESRWVFDKMIGRNLSLWNSAIVGYFRAGYFEEIPRLYSMLKSERIGVDSLAVTFSLKSCVELRDVEFGKRIHVDAIKAGSNGRKFVGSSLIGLYSRCGKIDDARQAFDEILDKDIVTYTALLTGYAQIPDSRARMAFRIASRMWREGFDANRVTLVSLLQASGHSKALKEGQSVHCYALRRGIGISDEVLNTSFVGMYSRCGASTSAVRILSQMGTAVASWNALIAGLIHCGQSSQALKLFCLMVKEANCLPDSITLANILTACSDLDYAFQVASAHAYVIRRGFPLDLVVTTALVDLYSRCGKIRKARIIFDALITRDEVLYSVMISGYVQNRDVDEAITMFRSMVKAGVRPSSVAILSLLSAFTDLGDIRKGRSIHGIIVRLSRYVEIEVSNQIINMYAKLGYTDTARRFFDLLPEKDLVSWTSMMMGYVNYNRDDKALALFHLMRREGEEPDSVTLITLLQAFHQVGCLEKVKEVHGYIYRTHLEKDVVTINSIIMAYAKCGRLGVSEAMFSNLVERGLTSWNTIIAAYGIHGHYREVVELFHRMPDENIMPDEMTFTSVLSACSHAGLVEEGWEIFNSMNSNYFSIVPKEEHYNCMVDLLARAGRLEEACDFLKCSPFSDKTNALRALLAACRVHGNTKLGEIIGRQLLDLDPQNSSVYALVSNVFSEAGKWNEAASLRSVARERGLRKLPGLSLIKSDEHICGV
ncbi:uncharacterized protein A4U43_C08F13730 [Asparagus officinalis]|uniref:pentatricopeptide repeat-containing protein At1g06140, mitochondrial-like n=1 Tax=Asparagus officinalis TaxID=4686 RepID=UPI00098E36BD|nr:pentatricopeptide repeat-containing protein At1g06140, mitochondrial-like [Asparagus officinalis]ONK60056.1 uncharacterized protein A4U43_C08F13730 [Asparagus officinalis]